MQHETPTGLELSIVILSYNTREMLRRCLSSVQAHAPRCPHEVLCVDDASSDGSADMVATEFPWVRLTRNPTNRGYAASNNVALRQARGRKILLLNSDVILVDPETLHSMVAFLDAHPEVGVAGQKLLNPDGTVQLSCRRFPTLGFSIRQSFLPRRLRRRHGIVRDYYMADFTYDRVAEVEMAAATCCILRREVLEQVGLMDEAFFLYVGDADWFYRIAQAGWKTCFLPDHPVIHHGGLSASPSRLDLIWEFHRGLYRYYRKHLARGTPLLLRPLVLPGILVRFAWQLLGWLGGRRQRVCSDDFK
jgi:GT2 family glycosyltransferase